MKRGNCQSCDHFWLGDLLPERGECRRHAPVVMIANEGGETWPETKWPIVNQAESCGDYEPEE